MLLSKLFLNESQHYAVLVASIHITRFVRIWKVELLLSTVTRNYLNKSLFYSNP
jgi:hypothetical protein